MKKIICAMFLVMGFAVMAFAHSGGLDARGGHTDHKTGEYHYHRHVDGNDDGFQLAPVRIDDFEKVDVLKVSAGGKQQIVKLIGVGSVTDDKDVLKSIKERFSGKDAFLELDKDKQDKTGRLLAYVWLSKPSSTNDAKEIKDKMYNAMLIVSGLAKVHVTSQNSKYNEDFEKLVSDAKPTASKPEPKQEPKRGEGAKKDAFSAPLTVKIEDFEALDVIKVSHGRDSFVVKLIGVGSVDKHAEVLKGIKDRFVGKSVTLEFDKEKQDKGGRLLAYVWLAKPSNNKNEKEIKEKMYNAMLIVSGLAKAHTTSKNDAYNDEFKKLGEETKKK